MLIDLGLIMIIGVSLATLISAWNGKDFKLVYFIAPFVERIK